MSDLAVGGSGVSTSGDGSVGGVKKKLGSEQQAALELLQLGTSVAETARTAGISRGIIYHWLRHDPVFQAAYNQWHNEMKDSCRSRLMKMTDKAASAIEKALEAGDARSALQLLKGMGLIDRAKDQSTDPDELAREAKIKKRRSGAKLISDEMDAEFGV